MRQIWKYDLAVSGLQDIKMPKGSEVLTVQVQKGVPCIWALGDIEEEKVFRSFAVFGTGHDVSDLLKSISFVGTFQLHGGDLVFHVFEIDEG